MTQKFFCIFSFELFFIRYSARDREVYPFSAKERISYSNFSAVVQYFTLPLSADKTQVYCKIGQKSTFFFIKIPRFSFSVILRLLIKQIAVHTLLFHQFLVRTSLDTNAVVDYDDLSCGGSGRQAVRYVYNAFIFTQ